MNNHQGSLFHHRRLAANRRQDAYLCSAAGIAEQAAQARADGERHFGRAIRSDGTVSETRLELARAAYAKAYELEN